MERACRWCGVKYGTEGKGAASKYCTDRCRKDAANDRYNQRARERGVKPRVVEQARRKAAADKRLGRICKTCGGWFRMRPGGASYKGTSNEGQFCSVACRTDAPDKRMKQAARSLISVLMKKIKLETFHKKECVWCGLVFYPAFAQERYCSDECRRLKHLKETRGRYRDELWPKVGTCSFCGLLFFTRIAKSKNYCSEKCAIKNSKLVKKLAKARRKERFKDVYVDDINIYDLRIRDKGRCGICGEKVDARRKAPHPKSPTIDHILPLSKGGWHEWENVQLACWECNCHHKRDNEPEQRQLTLNDFARNNGRLEGA